MTKEEILTLIKAGYTKADIDAMAGPEDPAPTTPTENNVKTAESSSSQATTAGGMPSAPAFDYNAFATALAKAMAGQSTGNNPPAKTKEEEVNEALKMLLK